MRLNKYIKIIFIRFIALFLCLYIIEGFYLSFMLNAVVNCSYVNLGFNNPYLNIVDDENYYRLCNRRGFVTEQYAYKDNIFEEYHKTIPFVFHWFIGGKAMYMYSYELHENGELAGGAWRIPVWITMDFSQIPWVVEVYEAP